LDGLDASLVAKPFDNGFFVKGGIHWSAGVAKQINNYYNSSLRKKSNEQASASGNGFLFGLGYQGNMGNDLVLRTSLVIYDSVAGESDISMSLVSVGITKGF
jgi:hypothetical protein